MEIKKVQTILSRSSWLDTNQKASIYDFSIKKLSNFSLDSKNSTKLIALLCTIPYIEAKIRRERKFFSHVIQFILEKLHLETIFCKTLSSWQLHVKNGKYFGFSPKEFGKILSNDREAVHFVSKFLVEHIGLDKAPSNILVDYQIGIEATEIAALQQFLNCEKGEAIFVDGLPGPLTFKAMEKHKIGIPENSYRELILSLESHGHSLPFFIPSYIKIRDFRYVLSTVKDIARGNKKLRDLILILKNHMDVPAYVKYAMVVYDKITLNI